MKGLTCGECNTPVLQEFDADYIKIERHRWWSSPGGSGGEAIPFAATFCAFECALKALQRLTTETTN